ncbi:CLUMA_CG005971, isoform A [Clunio marinus]|uniref:Fatty acyl-CoA reductase n=1 Tax=Clunio marinus TaxID=568069 RepID=A0A1J1HWP8_9DIPT|nr:CLUMA_CG005971, isoform A [Clunio marinus]
MGSESEILRNVSISQFYSGKSILVTGATGFMGKVIVEKLLRDCGDLKRIYILIRMKRGVDSFRRYQDYVEDTIFKKIREIAPERLKKISLIKGDTSQENLAIDPSDEEELIENLNIIFHCAAKAKFSLPLREALSFNTVGTLRVLQLATKIKNLLVFSHVSTSYCCPNQRILEERYQPACEDPYKVIKLLQSSRESDLDEIEPRIMKGYPNTYALSKIFAEDLAHSFRDRIKIVITRPSIVTSAWKEPYPGWVESHKSGLTGCLMAFGRGVLRTVYADPNKMIELIPVDLADNAIIALTCKRALMEGNDILYANINTIGLQSWTMKKYFEYELKLSRKFPLDLMVWYPYLVVTKNWFYYQFRRVCYHYVPAYFGDFFCRLAGEKALLVIYQRKFDTAMKTLRFYNTRDFFWQNDQFKNLHKELSEKDKEIFYCNFEEVEMEQCVKNNVMGVRKFLLKLNDEDSLAFRRGVLQVFGLGNTLVLLRIPIHGWTAPLRFYS